ncbi:MAG: family 78 glycoside hydrolase catalytic domain [Ilumatobacteraceae bacterium]
MTASHPHVDWSALMIAPSVALDSAPVLRREVTLDAGHGAVRTAWLHVTAMGVFEATIDGEPVADDVLSPGWTAFQWRHRFRSYDVTDRLRDTFVLGIALGNGWYRGRLGWWGKRALYGDRLGAIAQLEVEFADGHRQLVGTDEQWQAGPSAPIEDALYDGQTIDARRRDDRWTAAGAPLDGWGRVESVDFDRSLLTPYVGPPVVRHESVRPIAIWDGPDGTTMVDFGQNLVGWIRCTVQGEAGTEVTIRHAEVLEHGVLGVRPLGTAKATDRFVLSGGIDVFEPTMTFHGFRYAEISGWPGELTSDALEAVVVHSDLRRTGWFECSDPMVNQLHRNVVWGQRGNFLDVPTDCPQRAERLGWTGDIAAFAPTAAFLYDVDGFLRDWLADLAAEQTAADGLVPPVVPDITATWDSPVRGIMDATAIWSDAAVWVPWSLYEAYGDVSVLADQFESMSAHIDRIERFGLSTDGLWDQKFQFADWLDPDAPPQQPWKAKASPGVVATACLYRTATIVADSARLLGNEDDARRFGDLAARTRAAFNEHYVGDDGVIVSDAATVYALAIVFRLLDDDLTARAGEHLVRLVRERDHHIATGFAGTPFICDALTRTGHVEDAYALLLQRECPSWLYAVTMGATTIWERWDSMLPDGSINPGDMTSFNHYALGAVADWLHRTVAGIAPLEPGYASVRIAPRPGPGITWASAAIDTRHGHVAVRWELTSDRLVLDVELPDGITGVLDLPGRPATDLGAGTHHLELETTS